MSSGNAKYGHWKGLEAAMASWVAKNGKKTVADLVKKAAKAVMQYNNNRVNSHCALDYNRPFVLKMS